MDNNNNNDNERNKRYHEAVQEIINGLEKLFPGFSKKSATEVVDDICLFRDRTNDRLDKIESQQERTTSYLDKFIGLLTYPDHVDDQFKALWDAVEQLKSVELLKGVIELPTSDDNVKTHMEFYTIAATGESGISRNSLAKMCGIHATSISKLESTLVKKAPSHYLQSYVGQELTLVKNGDQVNLTVEGKDVGNLNIYKADFCAAVITHYAMKGNNKVALYYLANFCSLGITKWIHGITGYGKQ